MDGRCGHTSDCAVHNEPAMPRGLCNCGHREALRAEYDRKVIRQNRWVRVHNWWVRHGYKIICALITAAATTMVVVVHYSGG